MNQIYDVDYYLIYDSVFGFKLLEAIFFTQKPITIVNIE